MQANRKAAENGFGKFGLRVELELSSASQQPPVAAGICTQSQLQIGDRGHLTIKSCSADPLCRSDAQ